MKYEIEAQAATVTYTVEVTQCDDRDYLIFRKIEGNEISIIRDIFVDACDKATMYRMDTSGIEINGFKDREQIYAIRFDMNGRLHLRTSSFFNDVMIDPPINVRPF